MTPGKKHHILAPETPITKHGRRKSDGTQVVNESPDIDTLKQGKTTPRRMNASLALRRKTTFYSGHASRNLAAAEAQLNAQKLQNFNTSLPLMNNAGDKTTSRVLFPFLNEGNPRRTRSASRSDQTPSKDENVEVTDEPNVRRSMRKLFEDANDAEITLKSPLKKVQRMNTFNHEGLGSPFKSPMKVVRQRNPSRSKSSPDEKVQLPLKSPVKTISLRSSGGIPVKKIQSTDSQGSVLEFNGFISPDNVLPTKIDDKIDKNVNCEGSKTPRKTRRSLDIKKCPEELSDALQNVTEDKNEGSKTPRKSRRSFDNKKTQEEFSDLLEKVIEDEKEPTNEGSKTPRKSRRSLDRKKGVETSKGKITTAEEAYLDELLNTPSKLKEKNENVMKTPESNSIRPSRNRKTVERMGIDDVKITDTISPKVKFMGSSSKQLSTKAKEPQPIDLTKEEISEFTPIKSIATKSPWKSPSLSAKRRLDSDDYLPLTKKDPFDEMLETPPPKLTPKKAAKSQQEENILKTPEPANRPCRRRKMVERMGIDDIKLTDAISPKVKITPFSKYKHLLEDSSKKAANDSDDNDDHDDDNDITENEPNIVILDNSSDEEVSFNTSTNKEPIKVTVPRNIEEIQDRVVVPSKGTKRKRSSFQISDVDDEEEEKEAPKAAKRPLPILNPPSTPKINYQVKAIESPNGEFKLRINRTPQHQPLVQRISRRTSLQLGMSADMLLQMQTKSPSPVKKVRGLDKENIENASSSSSTSTTCKYSPLSSTSLYNLTTSPILNMPLGRRPKGTPTSPSGKRRKVSKKLYK